MADSFYGKYRGVVVDNNDPDQCGRVRVQCPKVLGDLTSNWALPNLPPNTFGVPAIGTTVWVEFECGAKDYPIWTGCWYTTAQWASGSGGFDPTKLVVSTSGEYSIQCGSITSNASFPHADLASDLG